ncbi:hypothetical protein SAMN05660420_02701 [Desulfuromusa kysingii]|uniref:Uncharacterized protein n=1 Tax=Desulfuromusa kysingii TaxID=37625 RepID=A0A1H4CWM1_9BACT|nr:hypothetical protein [Desulfuromusa kysingii]SEA64754.1 hypothetical protein SAMN05660420_02701 [Desulfuromusa kysingii]
MKKIIILIAVCMIIPSIGMAAVTLGSGTSISDNGDNPTNELSLSPGVFLSYDSDGDDSYALTGANNKGSMCYAVMSGDQGVYQQSIEVADSSDISDTNIIEADDSVDYPDDDDWTQVGG